MFNLRNQNGFTLIELMVVLVIVAIITAMASLAFYRADAQRGMVALTTLNRALIAMKEEAILRQQTLGLYLTDNGYAAYEIAPDSNGNLIKTPIPDDSLTMPDAFAGRWEMVLQQGAFMVQQSDGTVTSTKDRPILAISSDGMLTPIEFTFGPHQEKPWWSVTVNPNGQSTIVDLRPSA
jgi:type II secretion system protein H